VVTGVRRILTKAKTQMAVALVEDLHGSVEAVVFPRLFDRTTELWREDAILVLEGKVDSRGERPQLVVDRAEEWVRPAQGTPPPAPVVVENRPPAPVRNGAVNGHSNGAPPVEQPAPERHVLHLVVPRGEDDNACLRLLEQLHGLVERFPGSDQVRLLLHDKQGCRVELIGAEITIRHTPDVESQLRTLVGTENVRVAPLTPSQ
jgi:DNA polymerase-3 subunit alpha